MNFELRDLSDAFGEDFARENADYTLYAFLLGTRVDGLFPDILACFGDIDAVTGDEILVIAPRLEVEVEERTTERILGLLGGGASVDDGLSQLRPEIDEFVRCQVAQSYSVAKGLGDPNMVPCFIFFDGLSRPSSYVVWDLEGLSAEEVVKGLRALVRDLNEKCTLKKRGCGEENSPSVAMDVVRVCPEDQDSEIH